MLKKLAQIALLGTDRAGISEEVKSILEAQGIDTDADATQTLLEAAALYAQKEKAGFPLKKYKNELPKPADDADEYACSDNSAHHLQQILNGKFKPALSEFIQHLTLNNKQLPPELLPEIIQQRIAEGDTWEKIKRIVGKRGVWLMRQNPEWRKIMPLEDPELWATGNDEERVSVLKFLRLQFPELAIEMLQQSWAKESLSLKISFLEVLNEGLSSSDAAFLEMCLDDKKVEVRRGAAILLSQIRDSDYVKRLSQRLEEYIFFEKGNLQIELPLEPDAAGSRDGLFSQNNIGKQGLRTAWLSQMLALLPPMIWEEKFKLSPKEILLATEDTDYTMILLGAFLAATVRNKNKKWADAFLRFTLDKQQSISLPKEELGMLIRLISQEQYNQLLADYLSIFPLMRPQSPLSPLIISSSHYLNAANTLATIGQFQKYIQESGHSYGNAFTQKETLRQLGYQCDYSQIEKLKKGWDMNSALWRTWADDVEQFVRILQFRQVMKEGLEV